MGYQSLFFTLAKYLYILFFLLQEVVALIQSHIMRQKKKISSKKMPPSLSQLSILVFFGMRSSCFSPFSPVCIAVAAWCLSCLSVFSSQASSLSKYQDLYPAVNKRMTVSQLRTHKKGKEKCYFISGLLEQQTQLFNFRSQE